MEEVREVLQSGSAEPDVVSEGEACPAGDRRAALEWPGKYTERREHARGGMGRILLARDEHLGRDIVIKELPTGDRFNSANAGPGGAGNDSVPLAARFLREARITGQLEHPAIVPVHELGYRDDGTLYYTMKFVRGTSLAERLDTSKDLNDRLKLLPHLLDVCQAIAYAHSKGIVHRDLKPQNIMVGAFGETVVLDWGLARVKGAPTEGWSLEAERAAFSETPCDETVAGQVLGTPAYMAPEQARGHTNDVDERTDVYALGALLYAVLTGRAPHGGESREHVIRQAATEPPPAVETLSPQAPPELVAVCARAMAPEPQTRYTGVQELAEELQSFLAGGLVAAYDYRFSEHMRRFVRRHRRVLATTAAALFVLAGTVVYAYVDVRSERDRVVVALGEASTARAAAEQARDRATQALDKEAAAREESERQEYYRAIAYAHARIQQGEFGDVPKLLEGLPERFRGWEWGYLMGQCHLEEKNVQAHQGAITAFAATADGATIATTGEDGQLVVWDGATLTERWRYPKKVAPTALALDPAGETLVLGKNTVLVLDARTGAVRDAALAGLYDADAAPELALALTATGAPGEGGEGTVLCWPPDASEAGQVHFRFRNGAQVVRLNLARDRDPAFPPCQGPLLGFRLRMPKDERDHERFRGMAVRLEWAALTDDPAFNPEGLPDGFPRVATAASGRVRRAVWLFDGHDGPNGWQQVGDGVDAKEADNALQWRLPVQGPFKPNMQLVLSCIS